MRKFILTGAMCLVLGSAVLTGCGSKTTSNTEVTVADELNTSTFKPNADTVYSLKLPGAEDVTDISSYVVSYVDGDITVRSGILKDIFGFKDYVREDESDAEAEIEAQSADEVESIMAPEGAEVEESTDATEEAVNTALEESTDAASVVEDEDHDHEDDVEAIHYAEFEDENGMLLQLEENGYNVIFNGKIVASDSKIEKLDSGEYSVSLRDVVFAIGYSRVDVTRDGNTLTFEVVDENAPKEDVRVEEPTIPEETESAEETVAETESVGEIDASYEAAAGDLNGVVVDASEGIEVLPVEEGTNE